MARVFGGSAQRETPARNTCIVPAAADGFKARMSRLFDAWKLAGARPCGCVKWVTLGRVWLYATGGYRLSPV